VQAEFLVIFTGGGCRHLDRNRLPRRWLLRRQRWQCNTHAPGQLSAGDIDEPHKFGVWHRCDADFSRGHHTLSGNR
jgi:hypothetical protein